MSQLQDSAISFTNKDFSSLYPELMHTAASLSTKWDPTVSNETDPGVVFIKELALMGDKINYNADKNALENYPESVTQLSSSRSIFNIVGYYPHWYRSSKSSIRFSWIGEDAGKSANDYLKIPIFTSVTNADNSKIYTTTEQCTIYGDKGYSAVEALEGTINTVSINNSSIITVQMLDKNNRLYLDDYYVAENGIFISNYDAEGNPTNDFWTRVDNLSNMELKEETINYFELGLDINSSSCYIQFPDNINAIIGQGLCIKYLVTTGSEGTVALGDLNTIYESSSGTQCIDGEISDVQLSDTNVSLSNIALISSGKDYETIDEAWAACKHTLGTFESLITCRDYSNAVYNCDINKDGIAASNDYVCDRTNDIQDSYSIITYDTSNNSEYTKQELDNDSSLNAYNLKIYALQYPEEGFTTNAGYNKSFTPFVVIDPNKEGDSDLRKLVEALDSRKSICHDYKSLDNNKISFVKNLYSLNCQIIPSQVLTEKQQKNIKDSICKALYNTFNARIIDFGDTPNLEQLVNTIKNSDQLIKYASVDSFNYETHVWYYGANLGLNNIESWIFNDKLNSYPLTVDLEKDINFSSGNNQDFTKIKITLSDKNIISKVEYGEELVYSNKEWKDASYKKVTFKSPISFKSQDNDNFNIWLSTNAVSASDNQNIWHDIIVSDEYESYLSGEGSPSKFTDNKIYYLNTLNNYIYSLDDKNEDYIYSFLRPLFRDEIVSKTMLKGNTPVFEYKEGDFDYALNQNGQRVENVTSIKSNKDLIFDLRGTSIDAKIDLQDNEYLQFRRPKTDIVTDIGIGIKYEYVYTGAGNPISIAANEIHGLGENESLYLYNKPSEDSQYYVCYKYTTGAIIQPTFNLVSQTTSSITNIFGDSKGKEEDNYRLVANTYDSDNITIIDSISNQLTSTKTISILKIASVTIQNNKGYKWYAITNNINDSKFNLKFTQDPNTTNLYSAQLAEGEYFCYTDKEQQILNIYGSGTLIQFNSNEGTPTITWTCPTTTLSSINLYGISALVDLWQETTNTFTLTEQEFINISPKESIIFARKTDLAKCKIIISSQGIKYYDSTEQEVTNLSLKDFNISYILLGETTPTSLPYYDVKSNEWRARTYLNINCSPDIIQTLKLNQSITFMGEEGQVTIGPTETNPAEVNLQCNQPISLDGPADFYLLPEEDLVTGDAIKWIFYYYTENEIIQPTYDMAQINGNNDNPVQYNKATTTITITNPSDQGVIKIGNYNLPGMSQYILQAIVADNTTNSDYQFYINSTNDKVYDPSTSWQDPLSEDNAIEGSTSKKAVFYNVTTNSSGANVEAYLHYKKKGSTNTQLIIIIPPVRYATKSALVTNSICNLIQKLNHNNEFNLFHYVDDNVLIKNPLKSDSFLNANHPYNKYTLCQINKITAQYKQ